MCRFPASGSSRKSFARGCVPVDDPGCWQWVTRYEIIQSIPVEPTLTIPTRQPFLPDPDDLIGVLIIAVAVTSGCNLAQAQKCPSNPEALGTTRVLAINPREYPRVEAMDHALALPLSDKEVVLTFDDGPV